MISPELQPRSFRPYIASSLSAPSFSSFNNDGRSYSPEQSATATGGSNSHYPAGAQSSSAASRSRFSPSSFSHNARIAIALVPCAAFLLDLGGAPVVATLTLGLMLSYILDSLDLKSAAFFGVWLSLIASQIAFFFTSSLISALSSVPLGLLASFLCAQANFLIDVWAALQLK
ncbi:unnamed protein product [Linum trigynum]|uniref:Uncharacterized protein n=1 Tax=Linum trigynum TaxID=586398 RepID=A0AAV2GDC4_9ROSI